MPTTHLWRIKYRLHGKSFTFTISLLMTPLFTLQPQSLTRSLNSPGLSVTALVGGVAIVLLLQAIAY